MKLPAVIHAIDRHDFKLSFIVTQQQLIPYPFGSRTIKLLYIVALAPISQLKCAESKPSDQRSAARRDSAQCDGEIDGSHDPATTD